MRFSVAAAAAASFVWITALTPADSFVVSPSAPFLVVGQRTRTAALHAASSKEEDLELTRKIIMGQLPQEEDHDDLDESSAASEAAAAAVVVRDGAESDDVPATTSTTPIVKNQNKNIQTVKTAYYQIL
jgi:hypothetical protein